MQIVINETLTNYEVLGKNIRSKVLILHGWGQNLNLWKPVAEKLSTFHQVYLLDLPGFGSSSLPNHPYDIYDYADFVDSFIKKLHIKQVSVVGHSHGGKVAIILSSKPNSFKKLFLISPSGINKKPLTITLKIYLFKILKLFFPLFSKDLRNKTYSYFASKDYQNAGPLRETFKKVVNQNVDHEAKKITLPTIIIWGEKDIEVDPDTAHVLRGLIKGSHVRIVWDSGHSPHIEKSEKLYELLVEYL